MFDAAAPILSVEGLNAGYGRSQVLFECSLEVPSKGAVAVLGRNGAGKTTLLKTLAGEIDPSAGTITFAGSDCAGEPTEHRVRRGLGYVPQDHTVFRSLTVRENLALGTMADPDADGFDMALDFFPKLGGRLNQQAGTLSGGERKMLAISRAILGKPRLLMLDEPTASLDAKAREALVARLQELKDQGTAMIGVFHHPDDVLHLIDRIVDLTPDHTPTEDREDVAL